MKERLCNRRPPKYTAHSGLTRERGADKGGQHWRPFTLWFLLRGTGDQLELDATRAAAKAGDSASQTFNQRLSTGLKGIAFGAVGAAAGAAFGLAAKGGAELDASMRQLQADTGMTADEAKKASHAMAGMYGDNLQGFAEIGDAMGKVHNDLGLTGAAADAATAKFLKFGTATGQQAGAAVSAFDDILDAWNLTAEDAAGIMDKLIASHQKFGGSVDASEAALSAMAPAMQAANMSVDDGVALLNLFNASGLDASKASAMLAKAVKQLAPGQDLNDLIAQIAAIEDPTLRGQKAMEIFGAKAGVAMAQAIKPGMTSLDAFGISAGDAAGATEKAAGAIESGFGNQFQLLMKKAGGALADLSTNFGPLLMVAAQFGPKMIAGIGAGIGGMAAQLGPKLLGAMMPGAVAAGTASGTAAGGAMGIAIGPALILAIPLALAGVVAAVWAKINADLNEQAAAIGTRTGEFAKVATKAQMETARAAIIQGIADIKALPFGDTLYGDQIKSLWGDLEVLNTHIAAVGVGFGQTGSDMAAAAGKARGLGYDARALATDIASTDKTARGAATAFGLMRDGWANLDAKISASRTMRDLPNQIVIAKDAVVTAHEELRTALATGDAVSIAAAKLKLTAAEDALTDLRTKWSRLRTEMQQDMIVGKILPNGNYNAGGGIEGRAIGGPVTRDTPFLVGERGPELFVPRSNGTIVPSGTPSGGSMGNVAITINAQSLAGSEAEARSFARKIYDNLADEAARRGQRFAGT